MRSVRGCTLTAVTNALDVRLAVARIARALARIDEDLVGYEPYENVVREPLPAQDVRAALESVAPSFRAPLIALYEACDGIDAMNVNIGYHVRPLSEVVDQSPNPFEPVRLRTAGDAIKAFGSDGGGGLFALNERGEVLYLDHGSIEDGVFGDTPRSCRRVATDIAEFMERVSADANAFVARKPGHRYMV